MDNLVNSLFPKARCAEQAPPADAPEELMMSQMDEEMLMDGGALDSFKSPIEFRQITNRRTIFSPCTDKIEGFRFSITTPVAAGLMVQNKWQLYPPQNNKPQNQMMALMMPPKSSNYELDIYYINGLPDEHGPIPQTKIDPTSFTHFKGSIKAGGAVEAMIMKKLASWLNFRFEGHFMSPVQSQWNMHFIVNQRLSNTCFSLGNMSYSASSCHLIGKHLLAGLDLFYIPQQGILDMSLAAMIRRKNKNATFSLDKMQQRASVDFVTRLDKATQIGASFNYDLAQGESNAILAYQKNFKRSSIKVIGDTTGKVQSLFTLGDSMGLLKFRTYASGNIFKENYRFGYGIHIGMDEL